MKLQNGLIIFLLMAKFTTTFAQEEVVVLNAESGITETKINEDTASGKDGNLILNESSQLGGPTNQVVKPELKVEETKAKETKVEETHPEENQDDFKTTTTQPNPTPTVEIIANINRYPDSFVHIYSGRLHSNLKKVSNNLSKEIDIFGFGVANTINEKWEGVMALEIGQKKNEKNTSKNVVIYQLKVGAERFFAINDAKNFRFLMHGSLSIGDFNLRTTTSESQTTITMNKYAEGTLIGLHPGLGMRFSISNLFNLDALVERPVYLGKNRKNLGGFQYLARFALPW